MEDPHEAGNRSHHGLAAEGGVEVGLVQLLAQRRHAAGGVQQTAHQLVHEHRAPWEGVDAHAARLLLPFCLTGQLLLKGAVCAITISTCCADGMNADCPSAEVMVHAASRLHAHYMRLFARIP